MLLELENIEKRYGTPGSSTAVQVLKGISLNVEAGESVAIIGPSGSGKSTLLNIMGGLDFSTAGIVRLSGRNLSEMSDNELALVRNREIGFVFQLHHLLPHCTVLENVLVPALPRGREVDPSETHDRARQLLERVGLGKRADHRPGQLSGGESQRTAVVRALINKPGLLLADEPTGSLDRKSAEDLGRLLVDLNREEGVTLITVTHSAELAGRMGRRFNLVDGLLEES